MTAELHCHSFYSIDGWAPPEKLAESAAAAGVKTLALTDHNCVEGLERCRARALELGVRFINGAEFDVKWRGEDFHAVAFGFDPAHPALLEACARNWSCYDLNFARWAPIIEARWGVSVEELRAALPTRYADRPEPPVNKWFARSYMIEKGIFPDRKTALAELAMVGSEAEGHLPVEEVWPFISMEEVRDAVHAAGGVLLLAHVGGARHGSLELQLKLIHEMLGDGLDGFELYHPANTREEHFHELESAARRLGCAVSGGSDSHASPEHAVASIGRMEVPDWVVNTIDAALAERSRNWRRT